MSKKVIGIDLNEIFRAKWIQFDRYYREEFGDEGAPPDEEAYVYDFFKNYKFEDVEEEEKFLNEDLPDDINPLDYQLDENGESKVDAFAFKKEKTKLTAKEVFNRFIYDHYRSEIFGFAPTMYRNIDVDANKFYKKYMDQFEIVIFSKENFMTIQPTLFFISKLKTSFKSYHLLESNEEIWNKVDILITTDPELLKAPEGKTVIKLNRPYNTEEKGDYDALNLIDLLDNKDFEKLIDYKKE